MYTIVDIDVEENAGLKTEEALQVLHDEIKSVLDEYESQIRDRSVFHSSADHSGRQSSSLTLSTCNHGVFLSQVPLERGRMASRRTSFFESQFHTLLDFCFGHDHLWPCPHSCLNISRRFKVNWHLWASFYDFVFDKTMHNKNFAAVIDFVNNRISFSFNCAFLQGIFVIMLVMANLAIVSWDSWLRHMEIPQRVNFLLTQIQSNSHKIFTHELAMTLQLISPPQIALNQMTGRMKTFLNFAVHTLPVSLCSGP